MLQRMPDKRAHLSWTLGVAIHYRLSLASNTKPPTIHL
jgi:hypothetical protein